MLSKQIKKLELITEDGITHALTGNFPARFLYLDGTGIFPISRLKSNIPHEDGVGDKGFRAEARRMTLALYVEAQTADEVAACAYYDFLTYLFQPTASPLILQMTRFDNAVRRIEVYLDGQIDYSQSNRIGGSSKVIIPLYAPDPSFYDPTQQSYTEDLNGDTGANLLLPVANTTSWGDYPIMDVTGPFTTLSVESVTNNFRTAILDPIPSGETWRFDFRLDRKKVYRTSDNANKLASIHNYTLETFDKLKIYGYKELNDYSIRSGGGAATSVILTAFCTGTGTGSAITLYWYKRYVSL